MSKNKANIKSRPPKHKKFELAPNKGVNSVEELADEFIWRIFRFKPHEYMITDESLLCDFATFGRHSELPKIKRKIIKFYPLEMSDLESENIYQILHKIQRLRTERIYHNRSSGLFTLTPGRFNTWVYIMVVCTCL